MKKKISQILKKIKGQASVFATSFLVFIEKFRDDMIFQKASALSYSTMLSLVPIATLSLSIFSNLKFFHSTENTVKSFIIHTFLPTQADLITKYIDQFSKNLSSLNTLSIIGLLLSGVFLLITLENILNSIWKTENRKGWFRPIINYWSVLTLGPLLLGGSIYISGRMNALAKISQLSFLTGLFSALSVYAFNILFMFVIYYVMPNTKVKIRSALTGAFVSGISYEILRKYFTHAVSSLVYSKIYGSLAIIPIFMFWLYLVWIVVLIGAEISYYFQVHPHSRQNREPSHFSLTFGLGVYLFIVNQYLNNTVVTDFDVILSHFKELPPFDLNFILSYLKDRHLILESERGFLPYSEPYKQTTGELLNTLLNLNDKTITPLPHRDLIEKIKEVFKSNFSEILPETIESHAFDPVENYLNKT